MLVLVSAVQAVDVLALPSVVESSAGWPASVLASHSLSLVPAGLASSSWVQAVCAQASLALAPVGLCWWLVSTL